LQAAGIAVLSTLEDCSKLVHGLVLHAPDVVICVRSFHTIAIPTIFYIMRIILI
jgi:hypothetical protein